jgi:hypothetical protein
MHAGGPDRTRTRYRHNRWSPVAEAAECGTPNLSSGAWVTIYPILLLAGGAKSRW